MANSKPNPFTIDPDRLDVEWAAMAGLTRDAGYAEADADFAAARAKSSVDVTYARLELMVRQNPTAFGLPEKPVVNEVKARIEVHPDYQAALQAQHRADYQLRVAVADKFGMVDRRKALENLVELKKIEYYGEREMRLPAGPVGEQAAAARKRAVREVPDGGA